MLFEYKTISRQSKSNSSAKKYKMAFSPFLGLRVFAVLYGAGME